MGTALVVGQGMEFIDDDPSDTRERGQPTILAQEQAQALGSGEEEVGWPLSLTGAFGTGSVTGAQSDADRRIVAVDLVHGESEVFFEVITQGAEGGDIERLDAFGQRTDLMVAG
jgi:hypothetical protein